jgi:DNA replication protein DnaC
VIRLGETRAMAGAKRPSVSDRPLVEILKIPHTATIRARLAVVRFQEQGKLEESLELIGLRSALGDALERDELAAHRPAECWCYGRGGDLERAVLVPGDDVPMVLGLYCPCGEGTVRRAADDQIREQAKAFAEQKRVQGLWEAARIPDRFNDCTIATFPITTPKIKATVAAVTSWLNQPAWALVLSGDYGVGKTGLGIGLLRAAAERRTVGLFVKAPDLLARIRATYGKNSDATELEVLESLRTVPLLMLDDIGAEQETDWATSMLFQILDWRHDNSRKTIITTNLDVPALAVHLGARTMHRFHEDALFQVVEGPNLRKDQRGA